MKEESKLYLVGGTGKVVRFKIEEAVKRECQHIKEGKSKN